jgi:MFS family permease
MSQFIDLSLLRHNRDFRLLYTSQFISFIGTVITRVALPFQIYQLTQSTLMVGLLSLAQLLPLLFTALIGGVLADRTNRLHLVMISEGLLILGAIALTINASQNTPNLALIFIIATFSAAITGFHRPAFESMTQQLVTSDDYKALGGLAGFKFSFCMIVGPAIAGFIIAYGGVAFTYFIDLLSFIISLFGLAQINKPLSPRAVTGSSTLKSLTEGIRFATSRQELLGSYFIDIIAMIMAMPDALFPAIAQSLGGAKTLGLLYSAPATGALFLSFFSGWTARVKADGKAIALSAGFWGISMIGFGLNTHNLGLALLFLVISGALDAISGIFRSTLWNNTIPHELRGRLAGIEMLSYLSGPRLGDARAGALASCFGITTAIVSGGIFCVLGVTLCCWYMPKFWHYNAANK